ALLRVRDTGESHPCAGRIGAGLLEPFVQLIKRPRALLGLECRRIAETGRMAVWCTDHSIEVRAYAGLATLIKGVTGDADPVRVGIAGSNVSLREQRCQRRPRRL